MPSSGRFGSFMRGGSESGTPLEGIFNSLLSARGSAYDIEKTSIVYQETFSIAKAIAELWEANKRMTLQFDPNSMGPYLSRWEQIFNVQARADAKIEDRKKVIQIKMKLLTQPPTLQNVIDYCKAQAGPIFQELFLGNTISPFFIGGYSQSDGSIPNGAQIRVRNNTGSAIGPTPNGGTALVQLQKAYDDSLYSSNNNKLNIHIWKPRNLSDQVTITDQYFNTQVNQMNAFLDAYLPSYMVWQPLIFGTWTGGILNIIPGNNYGTFSGYPTFPTISPTINQPLPFEVIDDYGIPHVYNATEIGLISFGHYELAGVRFMELAPTPCTNKKMYFNNLTLDKANNLGNLSLRIS